MVKSSQKIKVSVIILTYNGKDLVRSELLDLSKQKYPQNISFKCFLVDNGSTDGTGEEFKDYSSKGFDFEYINTHSNLGFAEGNNVGIRKSLSQGYEYQILLNNDVILPQDWLSKMVGFMEKNKSVGLASPKIYFAKGFEFHKDRYKEEDLSKVIWYAGGTIDWDNLYTSHDGVDEVDTGQFDSQKETDLTSGSCMIVRRSVFEKIGFLDKDLFLYWEDTDFSVRAKKVGFKVVYFPDVAVWHKVSVAAGGSGSASNDYFLTRNRYYFGLRYAKIRTKMALFRDTVKLAITGRPWQKKGAVDALLGIKGPGSYKK